MATPARPLADVGDIAPGSAELLSTILRGQGFGCPDFPKYAVNSTNPVNSPFPSRLGFFHYTILEPQISYLDTQKLCLRCLHTVVPNGFTFWSIIDEAKGSSDTAHNLCHLQAPPSSTNYPPLLQAGTQGLPESVSIPIPDIPGAKEAWEWIQKQRKPFYVDYLHLTKKLTPTLKRKAETDSRIAMAHGISFHQMITPEPVGNNPPTLPAQTSTVPSPITDKALGEGSTTSITRDTMTPPLAKTGSKGSPNSNGNGSTGSASRSKPRPSSKPKESRAPGMKSAKSTRTLKIEVENTAKSNNEAVKLPVPTVAPANDAGTEGSPATDVHNKSESPDQLSETKCSASTSAAPHPKNNVLPTASVKRTIAVNGVGILKHDMPANDNPIASSATVVELTGEKSTPSNIDGRLTSVTIFKSLELSSKILSMGPQSKTSTQAEARTKNWSQHTLARFDSPNSSPKLSPEIWEPGIKATKARSSSPTKKKRVKREEVAKTRTAEKISQESHDAKPEERRVKENRENKSRVNDDRSTRTKVHESKQREPPKTSTKAKKTRSEAPKYDAKRPKPTSHRAPLKLKSGNDTRPRALKTTKSYSFKVTHDFGRSKGSRGFSTQSTRYQRSNNRRSMWPGMWHGKEKSHGNQILHATEAHTGNRDGNKIKGQGADEPNIYVVPVPQAPTSVGLYQEAGPSNTINNIGYPPQPSPIDTSDGDSTPTLEPFNANELLPLSSTSTDESDSDSPSGLGNSLLQDDRQDLAANIGDHVSGSDSNSSPRSSSALSHSSSSVSLQHPGYNPTPSEGISGSDDEEERSLSNGEDSSNNEEISLNNGEYSSNNEGISIHNGGGSSNNGENTSDSEQSAIFNEKDSERNSSSDDDGQVQGDKSESEGGSSHHEDRDSDISDNEAHYSNGDGESGSGRDSDILDETRRSDGEDDSGLDRDSNISDNDAHCSDGDNDSNSDRDSDTLDETHHSDGEDDSGPDRDSDISDNQAHCSDGDDDSGSEIQSDLSDHNHDHDSSNHGDSDGRSESDGGYDSDRQSGSDRSDSDSD